MFRGALPLFYFNSIKVRLELIVTDKTILTNLYFNSIKVRLEQSYESVLDVVNQFQFHKGTIRT